MKIRTRNILYILLPVVSLTLVNTSCKKDKGVAEPMRMFMPPGEIKATSAETSVTLTWNAALYQQSTDKSITYTVQVSKDSLFNTVERTYLTDTTGVIITQDSIPVRKKYYARIKTNGNELSPESKWLTSSSFKITGEQIFNALRDAEVKETSLTLRWIVTQGLTKLVFTPAAGSPMEVAITAADISSGMKVVNGLTGGMAYEVEIFQGTKSKGYLAFTTTAATAYTVVITPADNLVTVLDTCSNNAVIGLQPGVYSAGANNFVVKQKTVTIKSVSGNTFDTKVNFKEFTLRGNGAGINLQGIELDGTASAAAYLINLTGAVGDGEKCAFTDVSISDCIAHGVVTSFFRADRGTTAGDYTMNTITIKNTLAYDIGTDLKYNCFHLNELVFNTMTVTKSTFYNIGRQLLSSSTLLPSIPSITFDNCTFNNFGAGNLNAIMNAGSNPVKLNITNSIVANIPRPGGTVNTAAINATGASTAIIFNNNNTFNLTNGAATPAVLTWPSTNFTQLNSQLIDLGWTTSTTDFTLPTNSVLRTASSSRGPIGDPRWAY